MLVMMFCGVSFFIFLFFLFGIRGVPSATIVKVYRRIFWRLLYGGVSALPTLKQ